MKTHLDCIPCFLRQALEAARRVTDDTRVHKQIVSDVVRMTASLDLDRSPPFWGQAIHRRLRELTGGQDPYQTAKKRFNQLALQSLPKLAELVRQAEDPLLAAARCAVAANAIDMGVVSAFTESEARSLLRALPQEPFYGDWAAFQRAASQATDILYLADNAGEIVIDRLVIEQLGAGRVTVAVRGAPVLNDATLFDAGEVGLCSLAPVVDNGSDAPGTILEDCSASFRQRFERADLIISKGQGNFETLYSLRPKNIAFWFKVKCPLVSRQIGLPQGSHVLLAPGHLAPQHTSTGSR